MVKPSYLDLLSNDELKKRVSILKSLLSNCTLCPHNCKVNRLKGERGYCKTLDNVILSGASPHFGEEPELVGNYGSGTIFFSHCNLRCLFCQNYEISHCGEGEEYSVEDLAKVMIYLQKKGCHNINLVSPGHIIPQIVEAIFLAANQGLNIPIVYNTNGYDLSSTLELLTDIIDIYMPDIKFANDELGLKYLGVKDYFKHAKKAVMEMFRQVGNLKTNEQHLAYKGMMIRHLVMPENIAGTKEIMEFISKELSPDTYVNIMAQYYPQYKAFEHDALKRSITQNEYLAAIKAAKNAGLERLRTSI